MLYNMEVYQSNRDKNVLKKPAKINYLRSSLFLGMTREVPFFKESISYDIAPLVYFIKICTMLITIDDNTHNLFYQLNIIVITSFRL